ncbi:MAG TPA: cation:proton antiporter, partial [Cyclobacteriaceae bacterium]|nr:cation:proton antiporter [Cyclobacteriaceae bacterium]
AYLVAEYFETSGVLSVVMCGLLLSWTSSEVFNHQTRIQANAVWDTLIFLLNGLIFILIGLQLPVILENIKETSYLILVGYGAVVSLAAILIRIIWVFPATYLPRWMSKNIRTTEPRPRRGAVAIVAWSGMRGVVSLAAALALPLTINGTTPFPHRDMIVFLTFSVIFSTLVIQGLTLPVLVRWFKIDAPVDNSMEQNARLQIAYAAIEHIEENYSLSLTEEVLSQVKKKYEMRIQRMQKDPDQNKLSEEQIREFLKAQHEILTHERSMIIDFRNKGKIGDEVLHRIEYELDLEETRLRLELSS